MNPYDQPTYMTVEKCLPFWGTKEFEDEFLAELSANEHKLPLENMCRNGGYPSAEDYAELECLELGDELQGIVHGSFLVSFTEESPTGCRDMPWRNAVTGRIHFTMELATGGIEFEPPLPPKREYDSEEF